MFEISFDDFRKTCLNLKTDTKSIEIKCFTNKIIFTSKETNKQSIYKLCSKNNDISVNFNNKIISIDRNKKIFDDTKIICGTFKFDNLSNIKTFERINLTENIQMNNDVNLFGNIEILIKHNVAIAFKYNYSQYGNICIYKIKLFIKKLKYKTYQYIK
jgi:hypothetical protein